MEKKIVTLRKRKNLFRIPIRFIEKKIEEEKSVTTTIYGSL